MPITQSTSPGSPTGQTLPLSVMHWFAPGPPEVRSQPLEVPTATLLTASALEEFRAAITSNVKPDVVSASLHVTAPRGVSIPVARAKVRVRSFHFAPGHEPPTWCAATAGTQETAAPALRALPDLATERLPAGTSTRVRPPDDVIRLEDRLHYLLQPPLESLFVERELRFPFQPFPFQLAGVAFLFPRHAAILADEMGLGKTMQAVTSIRLLLHRGEIRNVLLVCPKPLVTNWQREFHTWAPEIPVMVIEGDQARRQWMWQLGDVPVRIANYEVVCRDREVFEEAGCGNREAASSPRASAAAFDLVVLDESQRIKNRSSATSQVVRSIARRRSWALTGTPVENSVEDLVGIFEFLAPGYLSADMKPRRMGRAVADFVLRRTKEQVLTDMPPKLIHDAPIELSPEQRESYRLAEDDGVVHLEAMGAEATIQHVFELVLRLKQICNFDPATGTSAKLERLEADLEEIAQSGRKALVFSQWVGTLTRLRDALRRFGPLEYHGQVPNSQRDGVIERFRNDSRSHVLLMSYGAGSVGLNLQFANYVFLFDRWWNPAVEDQAINRAHRIGATGSVTVTRFVAVDTIEERIDRVLQEKRELFETIFSEHDGPQRLGLSQQEFFGLFGLKHSNHAERRAA